jgi:hypothetical protein
MTRPIERPATLSPAAEKSGAGAGSPGFVAAKGSVSPQPLYLTADRLFRISQAMTELDWMVLSFVHESRYAATGQLIRSFWQTSDREANAARVGRRTLKRLCDRLVLDVLPRRVSGLRTGSHGMVYRVGRAGAKLLTARGISVPKAEAPGTLLLSHTLATTELVVRLREADQARELEMINAQQEPICWRGYLGPGASRRMLKPDLFVRVGAGALEDRWMIEVDLASESGRVLARKASGYLEHYRGGSEQREHGVYPRVLWSAPDERRAEQIADVLDGQPAEARRLFTVCRFDEVVAHLAAEAHK